MAAPEKPPAMKASEPTAASGKSSRRALTPAVSMPPTAMPASTSVVWESPALRASKYMSMAAPSAPRKAAAGTAAAEAGSREDASRAKKPAPALTPMMLGLAMALLSTACKSTPATASAAPESAQESVLGTRTWTIICRTGSAAPAPSAWKSRERE
jgi:hypothetical protein